MKKKILEMLYTDKYWGYIRPFNVLFSSYPQWRTSILDGLFLWLVCPLNSFTRSIGCLFFCHKYCVLYSSRCEWECLLYLFVQLEMCKIRVLYYIWGVNTYLTCFLHNNVIPILEHRIMYPKNSLWNYSWKQLVVFAMKEIILLMSITI